MDQNTLPLHEKESKNHKLANVSKAAILLLAFSCLILLGFFTFINYKVIERNKQTLDYFQKGLQLRNSYETLKVTRLEGISYSQFPHRLLEIQADENTMYSYRDDFYKDFSDPDTSIDRGKIVIYLTQRQVFDHPIAVASQPECEAMARIESEKRTPESYENEPTEVTLKYLSKRDSDKKVYIYTPKLGHCKDVFSDSQLLRIQGNANSIRYSF